MTDHNEPPVTHDENIADNSLPEAAVAAAEVAGQGEEHKGGGLSKSLLMGTAVGIGSAAIVAALLYTKRNKK